MLREIEPRQHLGNSLVAQPLVQLVEEAEILLEHAHKARQVRAFQLGRALAIAHHSPSAARFSITLSKASSSLMYCIDLPFLIEYSGGCAIKTFPRLISSCMCRKKKVSSSVRMCDPSTSASVIRMILPYRTLVGSKSSLAMPVPSA